MEDGDEEEKKIKDGLKKEQNLLRTKYMKMLRMTTINLIIAKKTFFFRKK